MLTLTSAGAPHHWMLFDSDRSDTLLPSDSSIQKNLAHVCPNATIEIVRRGENSVILGFPEDMSSVDHARFLRHLQEGARARAA